MTTTVRGIIENFLLMVNTYGMVPNGGRIYYTKRYLKNTFIHALNILDWFMLNTGQIWISYAQFRIGLFCSNLIFLLKDLNLHI